MIRSLNSAASIYLVDSDYVNRETLAALLSSQGFAVMSFRNGQEFLDCDPFQHSNPKGRCLLIDVNLDGMNAFAVQDAVAEIPNAPPLIFLATQGTIPQAVRAMQFGAVDFLQRPIAIDTLMRQVENALHIDRLQQNNTGRMGQIESRLMRLSTREQEVLGKIVEGKTSKEIGKKFGISQRTVENHRFRIMQKMCAQSAIELVRMVIVVDACRQFQDGRKISPLLTPATIRSKSR